MRSYRNVPVMSDPLAIPVVHIETGKKTRELAIYPIRSIHDADVSYALNCTFLVQTRRTNEGKAAG